MRIGLSIAAALSVALIAGAAEAKAPCKDDHGKFVKCPPAAAAPATAAAPAAPEAKAAKPAKCRSKKGLFAKCDAADAAPAATTPAPSAPAAKPAPAAKTAAPTAAAPAGAPAGATAKCKDGTFSQAKHHSGACSHHGGVAQWLN
jgi:hypothetical protein